MSGADGWAWRRRGAKLVNQQLTASNALAATEGLALARAMGMGAADLQPLLQLLERSWGNSTMLQRTGGIMTEALATADVRAALSADAPAPLRNFAKDLDFVLSAAQGVGLSMPATRAARDAVYRAAGIGLDTGRASVSELHKDAPRRATMASLPPTARPPLRIARLCVHVGARRDAPQRTARGRARAADA